MIRFSSTLSSVSLVIACGMTPIARRTPSAWRDHVEAADDAPCRSVGGSSVVSMRISVDLPAPFGPSRPNTSPGCTLKRDAVDGGEVAEVLADVSTSMAAAHRATPPLVGIARFSWPCLGAGERQQHVHRHADREPRGPCCRRAGGSRTSDVTLGAADVALRREAGVGAAIEDGALPLLAGGQPHGQRVADAHAVDVGLLDVGAHPVVVGIDRASPSAGPALTTSPSRAARTSTMPSMRREDLRVGEADVGLGALRADGGALLPARSPAAGCGASPPARRWRARARGPRAGVDLLASAVDPCAARLRNAVRASSSCCAASARPSPAPACGRSDAGVLEVRLRRGALRLGGGDAWLRACRICSPSCRS